MSNAYLEILGLQPGASKNQIKSAYRTLSKKYHPDINKHPDAHDQFVAINEAYRFLSDVGPSPHNESVSYNYDPYHFEYEERRRRAREFAFRQAREAQRRQEASIKYALGIFNTLAYIILIFNALLVIDYVLPVTQQEEAIIKVMNIREGRRAGVSSYRYDDIVFANFTMRINKGQLKGNIKSEATVFLTPAFQIPKYADVIVNGANLRVFQVYSIYKVFGYLIPGIFVIALFYTFILKTLDHKFTLAILMTCVFAFQLYMFFKF